MAAEKDNERLDLIGRCHRRHLTPLPDDRGTVQGVAHVGTLSIKTSQASPVVDTNVARVGAEASGCACGATALSSAGG